MYRSGRRDESEILARKRLRDGNVVEEYFVGTRSTWAARKLTSGSVLVHRKTPRSVLEATTKPLASLLGECQNTPTYVLGTLREPGIHVVSIPGCLRGAQGVNLDDLTVSKIRVPVIFQRLLNRRATVHLYLHC